MRDAADDHTDRLNLPERWTRRRVLLSFGGAAIGATLLSACGPAAAPPAATTAPAAAPTSAPAAAPTTAPAAASAPTTAPAAIVAPTPAPAGAATPKMGGTFKFYAWTEDPPTLDPYLNVSFRTQGFAAFFYSRLLMSKKGPGVPGLAYIMEGDLAESWTVSPDGKTYTFKLRPNAVVAQQATAEWSARHRCGRRVVVRALHEDLAAEGHLRRRRLRDRARRSHRRVHAEGPVRALRGEYRGADLLDHAQRGHRSGRRRHQARCWQRPIRLRQATTPASRSRARRIPTTTVRASRTSTRSSATSFPTPRLRWPRCAARRSTTPRLPQQELEAMRRTNPEVQIVDVEQNLLSVHLLAPGPEAVQRSAGAPGDLDGHQSRRAHQDHPQRPRQLQQRHPAGRSRSGGSIRAAPSRGRPRSSSSTTWRKPRSCWPKPAIRMASRPISSARPATARSGSRPSS